VHEAEVHYDASSHPRSEATWQRHWCIPKAISWWTFTYVGQTRCTCVGWAQTIGIWPTSIVVRCHQWLACS
jgi:hypothetical protein